MALTRFALSALIATTSVVDAEQVHASDYGHPSYLEPESLGSKQQVLLPSNPTLFLFVRDNVQIELESNGKSVGHRILPTSDPEVDVFLDVGPLVVRTQSENLYGATTNRYWVAPHVMPSRKARSIKATVEKWEDREGGVTRWIDVDIDSDARFESSEYSQMGLRQHSLSRSTSGRTSSLEPWCHSTGWGWSYSELR